MWLLQSKTEPGRFVRWIHPDGRIDWTTERRDARSFRDYRTAKLEAARLDCHTYHINPIW